MTRWPHQSPTTAGWVLLKRGPRKPAHHPHHQIYPLFRISTHNLNAIEVWPHAQDRLCCPACHHFKTTPTSLRPSPPSCRFHPTWWQLTTGRVLRRRWDLRSFRRYLSPHATGLTPGPCQVLLPLASLTASAFSLILEDRRVSSLVAKFIPQSNSPSYSRSTKVLRSCTVRFMLWPAALAGTPDWVKPAYHTSRLGTMSGQVQPVCYHTNPPPAYLSKRAIDKATSFQVTSISFH